MKYIKQFRLFETGEWNRDVDWDYVKEHPDDDSEESNWIKHFQEELEYVIDDLDKPEIFKILDIKGFDMYQGPYAIVKIFDKKYKIWTIGNNDLWIDDFPVDNTSQNAMNPGLIGKKFDISDILNGIIEAGGIEVYLNAKKYNL